MKISQYLNPNLIHFFEAKTRDEALRILIQQLDDAKQLKDREAFLNAILEREKIVSTGIGMGVAIPHAKLPEYNDFFISIGILQKGVDWHTLDGSPVRLIFLIGGPDDKQTEYLKILSSLTFSIRDEERRKKILTSNSSSAIIELFGAL